MRKCVLILTLALFNCSQQFQNLSQTGLLENFLLLNVRSNRVQISGYAIKGIVRNGQITVREFQSDGTCSSTPLQISFTNSDGSYALTTNRPGEAFCITVRGNQLGTTSVYDEVTEKDYPISANSNFQLQTIYPVIKIVNNRRTNLFLSPFSRLLTKRMQYLKNQNPTESVAKIHSRASKELVIRFGLHKGLQKSLSFEDISEPDLEDLLIDLQNPSSPVSLKFLATHMGFAKLANLYPNGNFFDSFDSLEEILDAFARDFADGSFDGKDENGNSITIGSGGNQVTLPSNPLTSLFLPAVQAYFADGGKLNFGTGEVKLDFDITTTLNTIEFVDNAPIGSGSSTYTIGGTIAGLVSNGLELSLNGNYTLNVNSGATSFQFSNPLAQGSSYNVTIQTQPNHLNCTVTNGSGTVTANVSNIQITCNPVPVLKWDFENTLTPVVGTATLTLVTGSTSYNTGYNGSGNALVFDGSSYYNISGTTASAYQNQNPPWTVAFWIYPTTLDSDPDCVLASSSGSYYGIKSKQYSTGKIGITTGSDFSFADSLTVNTWTHVVIVSSGSQVSLYLNGTHKETTSNSGATSLGLPLFRLGNSTYGTDKLSARLDELIIYPIALTATQVSNLYSSY